MVLICDLSSHSCSRRGSGSAALFLLPRSRVNISRLNAHARKHNKCTTAGYCLKSASADCNHLGCNSIQSLQPNRQSSLHRNVENSYLPWWISLWMFREQVNPHPVDSMLTIDLLNWHLIRQTIESIGRRLQWQGYFVYFWPSYIKPPMTFCVEFQKRRGKDRRLVFTIS